MASQRSSSLRSRLGKELRRLRSAATLTTRAAAKQLGWSPAKVSRIETGNIEVTDEDLRRLLDLYQASDDLRDSLLELRGSANKSGWWDGYADMLREGYWNLLSIEDGAKSEHSYTQMLIPGLLQTEAYAEAVIGFPDVAAGIISRRVTVRANRQRVLTRKQPLDLIAILDEACLRRQVGGNEVIGAQLLHLIDMARLPNVTIQVLPFEAGYHHAITSAFKILYFRKAGALDVVFLENMTRDFFIDDDEQVHRYTGAFKELRELALSPEGSISLIGQIARGYGMANREE